MNGTAFAIKKDRGEDRYVVSGGRIGARYAKRYITTCKATARSVQGARQRLAAKHSRR